MILLADVDILKVILVADLFNDTCESLSINPDDVVIGPQTPFSLSKLLTRQFKESIAKPAKEKLKSIKSIKSPIADNLLLETLLETEGIDEGEAFLTAYTIQCEGSLIATGDKRFIRSLSSSNNLDSICSRLQNRILCLEVLMLLMIEKDFENIRSKIVSVDFASNITLKNCFGSNGDLPKEQVTNGFSSEFNHLKNSCYPGILFCP